MYPLRGPVLWPNNVPGVHYLGGGARLPVFFSMFVWGGWGGVCVSRFFRHCSGISWGGWWTYRAFTAPPIAVCPSSKSFLRFSNEPWALLYYAILSKKVRFHGFKRGLLFGNRAAVKRENPCGLTFSTVFFSNLHCIFSCFFPSHLFLSSSCLNDCMLCNTISRSHK